MAKYFYTQTVVYAITVEAETDEAADAIVNGIDLTEADIMTATGCEEDGYDE